MKVYYLRRSALLLSSTACLAFQPHLVVRTIPSSRHQRNFFSALGIATIEEGLPPTFSNEAEQVLEPIQLDEPQPGKEDAFNFSNAMAKFTAGEDFMHIHKTSSVACILASMALAMYGLACIFNHDLDPTSHVMDLVGKVWSLATIVSAISAIALSPTRTLAQDIAVRAGFNIMAFAKIIIVSSFAWMLPWWDSSFDWALDVMMVGSVIAGSWVALEALLRNEELTLFPNLERLLRIITLVPAMIGMVVPSSLGLIFNLALGNDGLSELVQKCPGFMANALFANSFLVIALGLSAFAMTAQDRKLLKKDQMYAVILLILPALASQLYMAVDKNTLGTLFEMIQRNHL